MSTNSGDDKVNVSAWPLLVSAYMAAGACASAVIARVLPPALARDMSGWFLRYLCAVCTTVVLGRQVPRLLESRPITVTASSTSWFVRGVGWILPRIGVLDDKYRLLTDRQRYAVLAPVIGCSALASLVAVHTVTGAIVLSQLPLAIAVAIAPLF